MLSDTKGQVIRLHLPSCGTGFESHYTFRVKLIDLGDTSTISLSICQLTLPNYVCYCANFQCCKWANVETTIKPFGHTEGWPKTKCIK